LPHSFGKKRIYYSNETVFAGKPVILSPWQDAGMDPWQLFVILGFSASSMLISIKFVIVADCGI
jgi:hypothetical protein